MLTDQELDELAAQQQRWCDAVMRRAQATGNPVPSDVAARCGCDAACAALATSPVLATASALPPAPPAFDRGAMWRRVTDRLNGRIE
jgi:hypothetical protein